MLSEGPLGPESPAAAGGGRKLWFAAFGEELRYMVDSCFAAFGDLAAARYFATYYYTYILSGRCVAQAVQSIMWHDLMHGLL